MATRPSSRRKSGRSSSSSGSNPMPMVLGGVGLVAVVLVFVMMSGKGGGKDGGSGSQPAPANQPAAAKPHVPQTALTPGSAKAGKTPAKPAPALTMDTLEKVRALLQEAKELKNEGTKLRDAQKIMEARDVQSKAAAKLDELKKLIEQPLAWQEEAEFDGWAQPAEYVTLANLWGQISSVEKAVRMSGGTR